MARMRKTQKMRGSRTFGYGSKKKHRGSGNRGGKGRAGSGKRADSKKPSHWHTKYFGKKGFKKKNAALNQSAVNISYIEENLSSLLKKGIVKLSGGFYELDIAALGFQKLLATGKATKKFKLRAASFSEGAKKKIQDAGGIIIESKE